MSNPKNPIITFKVNLARNTQEAIGPVTNTQTTAVLHPDMHQTDADTGRTASEQHKNQRISWLPGFLCGENIEHNHDYTITAYGMKAKYLKDTYSVGSNPILTVITETFESA